MRTGVLAAHEPGTWIDLSGTERRTMRSSGRIKYRDESAWALRRLVYDRDKYCCQICGWVAHVPESWNQRDALLMSGSATICLVLDHIISVANCGSHHPDNLQALCDTCNFKKQRS